MRARILKKEHINKNINVCTHNCDKDGAKITKCFFNAKCSVVKNFSVLNNRPKKKSIGFK